MGNIQVLDQITIDKIAAGEVIERPSSIVKELVENSIDAGADAVTVEIKDGGISFIRVTDNGSGIPASEVRTAFLRHSTSKIRTAEDIQEIGTLGFRGEALSSISAVTQLEMLTKTADSDAGVRYTIEGGKETGLVETGAPDGTTFLIRQLFYNTPARRKFLKTAVTEASHVQELMVRLAMSHPEVSFQFINQGQTKIHTAGTGRLKDVIYHIYGRDITAELIPVDTVSGDGTIHITGFAARPTVSRGNRNFENYYVNGRYMKSKIIAKGIEDAYKGYTMQHKYPFVVLLFSVDGHQVDVNVHPQKMEVRFSNQQYLYDFIFRTLRDCLEHKELIPEAHFSDPEVSPVSSAMIKGSSDPTEHRTNSAMPQRRTISASPQHRTISDAPQHKTAAASQQPQRTSPETQSREILQGTPTYRSQVSETQVPYSTASAGGTTGNGHSAGDTTGNGRPAGNSTGNSHSAGNTTGNSRPAGNATGNGMAPAAPEQKKLDYFMQQMRKRVESYHQRNSHAEVYKKDDITPQGEQMNLFKEKLLTSEAKQHFHMIGQLFDTYWLIEYEEQLYIIDQHAAHEKVLYEKKIAELKNRTVDSQYLSPPLILNLNIQEADVVRNYHDLFVQNGFEIEPFGNDSFAVRAVPSGLSGIANKELLMEILNDLTDDVKSALKPEIILDKIASRSCKAAVKGNSRLSEKEAEYLISQLLELENPYHCPHGRPTIIRMSKRELEKKFKRIV